MKYNITVLILNFNGKTHLKECISTTLSQVHENFNVVLIDNGSRDGSVEFVRTNFKDVDTLALKKNFGTIAINKGIRYAIKNYKPRYIGVLNNDLRVDENWLNYLAQAIESEKNIAAVATNMLYYDQPEIINSQGGNIIRNSRAYDINRNKRRNSVKRIRRYILAPCFGATLLNVSALLEVGLLDERYFAYLEDLDWGWRTNLYGYKVIFEAKAIVYHKASATWKKCRYKKAYLLKRNAMCNIIKNFERKNLFKTLPHVLKDEFIIYPLVVFSNIPRIFNIPFFERPRFIIIPFKSFIWNLVNLHQTLQLRKKIQTNRKVKDEAFLDFLEVKNR